MHARRRIPAAVLPLVPVAAQGHVWRPNPDRGIFCTLAGGRHFSSIRVRHGDTHDLWIDAGIPPVIVMPPGKTRQRGHEGTNGGPGPGRSPRRR